jgi:hypothetical protein
MVVPASCGAYVCEAPGAACRTSCGADGDCAGGNRCMNGACVPPPDPDGGAGATGGAGASATGSAGAAGGAGAGGAGGASGAGGTTGAGGSGASGAGGGSACPGHAFCDDFEDGNADGWSPIGGTWSIVSDGSSVFRGANGPGNAIAGSPAWADQTVEARVKVTQFANAKPGSRGGVIARYANATSYYVFLLDGTGALRLLKDDDTPASHTGACGKIDVNLAAGSWHTFKLAVSGSTSVRLQTFLDGAAVHDCTTTSGTVPAGAAGAYVYGANTIVEFDDMKVSTP